MFGTIGWETRYKTPDEHVRAIIGGHQTVRNDGGRIEKIPRIVSLNCRLAVKQLSPPTRPPVRGKGRASLEEDREIPS
jgi:hypothetical protein